jgi:transcriptional repressor NrdR
LSIEFFQAILKVGDFMKCLFCSADDTKVIDSRLMLDGFSIKRRRKCQSCDKRFNTFEKIELSMPMVVKSDGRREAYNKEKLHSGLIKACQKRPISTEQIEHVLNNIGRKVLETSTKEITTIDIGKFVMDHLHNLDPVAYVRFASVYKNFQDINEFLNDLKTEQLGQMPDTLTKN